MARARNIKPSFFDNDILAELEPLARLLFIGLWCLADREGRLEDRPKRIRKEILGYDDCDCDKLLQALHDNGFILRYESGGGKYIQVVKFMVHQNPHHREPASSIPAPGLPDASPIPAPGLPHTGLADSPSLIPDSPSLIPSSADADSARVANEDEKTSGNEGNGRQNVGFEDFWEAYPRKEGKEAARKAWLHVNPDATLHGRMLEAIDRAQSSEQWKAEGGRFIPSPAKWLNEGRWEDEHAQARASPQTRDRQTGSIGRDLAAMEKMKRFVQDELKSGEENNQ